MSEKILLIEDNPDQITILRLRLENAGYFVMTAMDSQEGLKKANEDHPDLILLDVLIPTLNGFKVCKILKSDLATKHIPVVMISGYGIDDIDERSFAAGANDCIRKPYEPEVLLQKIHVLLEQSKT
ncbi:MAG: response regulator [Candidatus Omnitrophica bacterium]|nr:response regulator [Candidatus Omnitrophota bacterium]